MQKVLAVMLIAMLVPSAPVFAEESAPKVPALSVGSAVTPSRSLQASALRNSNGCKRPKHQRPLRNEAGPHVTPSGRGC